jgi:hypothetical protein
MIQRCRLRRAFGLDLVGVSGSRSRVSILAKLRTTTKRVTWDGGHHYIMAQIAEKRVQIAQLGGLTFQLNRRNFFRRSMKGHPNPVASFGGG